MSAPETDVVAGLARVARRCFGNEARVVSPVRLSGGAMNELWAFDVAEGARTHPLILRRARAASPAREPRACTPKPA